jgi:hypothetical protein
MFISISATKEEITALNALLCVLVLAVNGNDTSSLDLSEWIELSKPLISQLGVKREFTKIMNKFISTKVFKDPEAQEFGKLLKSKKAIMVADLSISKEMLGLYNDCVLHLASNSEPAWKRIHIKVGVLKIPSLSRLFLDEDEDETTTEATTPDTAPQVDVKALGANLKKIALKLGKSDSPFLEIAELQDIRKNKPQLADTLKEYYATLKQLNAVIKAETFKFVRSSGKDLVPITELKEYLKRKQVLNNLPTGFLGGLTDELGKHYTAEGRQLDRATFGVCVPNPKYDPELDNTYVLTNWSARVRFSTLDFKKSNKTTRHALVKEFLDNEEDFRRKWLPDFKKAGTREQILAVMVELLYQTSCRIGGKDNATAGEKTYGLSTLLVSQMTFSVGMVAMDYAGKKSHEQHHELRGNTPESKAVINILKMLVKGKSEDDLVFTYRGKPVSASMVRDYLKELGIELSPHKFRQLSGTKLAIALIAKSPFSRKKANYTQKDVDTWLDQELKKVGEVLHHTSGATITGRTAAKSYIDPVVLHTFYTDLGLRSPSWVPAA